MQKKWFSNDADHIISVNLEREKEDSIKGTSNTLPPTKPNHFRPNGIRSNILKGEQMYSSKTNGALSGKSGYLPCIKKIIFVQVCT